MALYRYKALNARGEVLDGQMEAASDAEVAILKRLLTQMHRNLADLMHDKPAG